MQQPTNFKNRTKVKTWPFLWYSKLPVYWFVSQKSSWNECIMWRCWHNVSRAYFLLFTSEGKESRVPYGRELPCFINEKFSVQWFQRRLLRHSWKSPSRVTQHSNLPLRAARDRVVRGNCTTVHNASQLPVRYSTAAASRVATPVLAAGSVSSAVKNRS